jgi:hypothetical protein
MRDKEEKFDDRVRVFIGSDVEKKNSPKKLDIMKSKASTNKVSLDKTAE